MRAIVALLLLANLAFFAWTQGWLGGFAGAAPGGDREPERLARQVHPEVVRVLTPQAVAAAAIAAESRLTCLEAGPFDEQGIAAAEMALSTTLPSGTWTRQTDERAGRWIVYMGRYASREAQQKKEQELSRIGVRYDAVTGAPALEPGLSLGSFTTRDAADAALADLTRRGIHTAKLVELPGGSARHMLRVERADPELALKVSGLKLDALGKGFANCARPP